MKCLLLAAGYATRLYPLTKNFPKPLLKVGEKTILDWLIDDIHTSGKVSEYAVVTNHRFAGIFEDWAKERQSEERAGQNVIIIDDGTETNETRLGAVRDIAFALDRIGYDDDVLVVAGDNVLDFSLCRFIDYAEEKGTSCLMRYQENDIEKLKHCGVAVIGDNDIVLSMTEKPTNPTSPWCTPPFYYFTSNDAKRIREAIDEGCAVDAPGDFISWLCRRSPIHSMKMPGKRFDVGSLESYRMIGNSYGGIMKK